MELRAYSPRGQVFRNMVIKVHWEKKENVGNISNGHSTVANRIVKRVRLVMKTK